MKTLLDIEEEEVRTQAQQVKISDYDKFVERIENSYFFVISMIVLISSSLGGVTLMCIHQKHGGDNEMMFTVCVAMATNIACIVQTPMKWTFNLFIISLLVNSFLLLLNYLWSLK